MLILLNAALKDSFTLASIGVNTQADQIQISLPPVEKQVTENKHSECEKCGWPICSQACQNNINHVDNECKLTADRGDKVSRIHDAANSTFISRHSPRLQVSITSYTLPHPLYGYLLPLRCLMLKENNPEKWKKLLELQSQHDGETEPDQFKLKTESASSFIPR